MLANNRSWSETSRFDVEDFTKERRARPQQRGLWAKKEQVSISVRRSVGGRMERRLFQLLGSGRNLSWHACSARVVGSGRSDSAARVQSRRACSCVYVRAGAFIWGEIPCR